MDVFDLVAKISLDDSAFVGGLNRVKSLAGGIASTAFKVTTAAVGAATTAVTALGGASIKAGADFDKSMSQVYATMGDKAQEMVTYNGETVSSMEALRDFAQEMGRTTAFSATQSAEALNYMALAGYDAETSMNMLPNVMNLAAAGTMELGRASDMLTDTQTAFGISLERTTLMVDEMAKAASTGNTSVEQLGDAFLTVGGLAQELNGGMVTLADGSTQSVDGVQELEIALTAMANAGIKGSEAGTHMRNMLLKLSSPTADGTKQLEALGVSVFDTEGNMRSLKDIMGDLNGALGNLTQEEKIQAISDLFNTRDLASAEALLNAVGEDWDNIGAQILTAGDVSSIVGDKLSGMVEDMQYNFDRLGGDTEAFAKEMKDYLHFEYDLDETKAQSAIDAFIESVNNGVTSTDALTEAVGKAGGAASQMAETQLDNLSGDITLFKSALEGAQIAISDELSPTLREFVQFGTQGLSDITAAFKEGGLTGAVDAFGSILSEGLTMIIEQLPTFIEAGIQLLEALGQGLTENLDIILEAITTVITMLVEHFTANLPSFIDMGFRILETIANALNDNIDLIIEAGKTLLFSLTDGLINNLPDLLSTGIEIIVQLTTALLEAMPDMITDIADALVESLPILIQGGIQLVEALVTHLPDIIVALMDALPRIMEAIVEGFRPIVTKLGGVLKDGLLEFGEGLKTAFDAIWEAFKEALHLDDAFQWGKDLIDNFIGGIAEKTRAVWDAVSGIAGGIADFIGFSEPKKGPLSVFHTFAPDMMELFAKGIKDNERLITDQIGRSFDFGADIVPTDAGMQTASRQSGFGAGIGSMVVNVYGTEHQNVRELSQEVIRQINKELKSKRLVYA